MEKFLVFLAQGLGSGLAKKAPGTWGSLVAVIIAWFITPSLLTIIIAAAVGVYICTVAAKALNDDDPSCVVFDEWVGMWIALWALPHHLIWYVLILLSRGLLIKYNIILMAGGSCLTICWQA